MKRIVLFSMLMMLPACSTSCRVSSTPTNSMPRPASLSLFRVNEIVEVTLPNGDLTKGIVLEVMPIGVVTMPDGTPRRSRIYVVRYLTPEGESRQSADVLDMVPEFAMEEVK